MLPHAHRVAPARLEHPTDGRADARQVPCGMPQEDDLRGTHGGPKEGGLSIGQYEGLNI